MKRFSKSMQVSWDLKIMKLVYRWVFNRDFSYMEAHPSYEIRMAAIKAYILKKSREVDLSDLTQGYVPYKGALKSLHLQMQLISKPLFSRWGQRGQQGLLIYQFWTLFSSELWAAHRLDIIERIENALGTDLQSVKWTLQKVGDVFSYLLRLIPSLPEQVSQEDVNNTLVGISTLLLTTGTIGLAASFRDSFLRDESYQVYRKIKTDIKEMIELGGNPSVEESEKIIKSLELLNAVCEGVQMVYDRSSIVRFTRLVNGLSAMALQSYYLYNSILDQATKYALTLSGTNRDEFVEIVAGQTKDTPGYIFDSQWVRSKYINFISLSGRLNLKPALTSEEFGIALAQSDRLKAEISLLVTAQKLNGSSPVDLRVNVAYALLEAGARDYAFDLIGEFPSNLIDALLTEKQGDSLVTKKLQHILIESRRGGSLRNTGYFEQLFKDLHLAAEKLRSRFTGRREAVLSLTRKVPARGLFFGYLPLRGKLEALDARNLENKMTQSFDSLPEVVAYLDQEVIGKGGLIEEINSVFVGALSRRRDWINSLEDVDLLISRSELWPQFSSSISSSSPLESAFILGIRKLRNRFPSVWKYEPALAEKIHRAIVIRLKELDLFPKALPEKMDLWKKLTSRGVTTITDKLFHEIYSNAEGLLKNELELLALNEGRVWETEIKSRIAHQRIFNSNDFKKLSTAASASAERIYALERLVAETQKLVPEGGRVYWELLDEISVGITSSEAESKIIHEAKSLTEGGEKQEDFGLRVLSQLTDEALGWSPSDQWALIQFLRNRGPVTVRIQDAFNVIGPERVQRMFDLLPLMARTQLIDAFIDSQSGLLGKFKIDGGWGSTILNEIFVNKAAGEVQIAKEILEAFLHALKKTGDGALRTYIVSYLLAQPQGQSDTALVLKNVLEIFGATGVKIGQFLSASEILPEKETAVLRSLQEQAKVPNREEIYADIRDVLGRDSVPFRVGALKGAASIKYAIEVFDNESQQKAILKLFRLESIAHTRTEFNLLDRMADFLVDRYGSKYGIFRSIVRASRAAVERELVAHEEVKKSLAAQRYIYVNLNEANISVKAPFEALVADRATLSEFAEGSSFFTLRDDVKPVVAQKILSMEAGNLFSDKSVILFDPDRHAGNYRIHVREYSGQPHLVFEEIDVSAIDMGQLLKIKPATRERIIELFAISQILKEVGPNAQLANRVANLFGLGGKQKQQLLRQLSKYYPDKSGKEISSYFALLASLEAAGAGVDIVYFDFVRAIIQLQQYEPFVQKERSWKTPSELFAHQVKARADNILPGIQLTSSEKMSYAWGGLEGNFLEKIWAMGKLLVSNKRRAGIKDHVPRPEATQALEGGRDIPFVGAGSRPECTELLQPQGAIGLRR